MARFFIRSISKVLTSAANRLFGAGSDGVPKELTAAEVRTLLSVYTISQTDTAISTAVANLVASSPATLDTLNELAAALGNDANFSTTVSAAIGAKYTKPGTGIPKTDLASAVQTSLDLADSSLQSLPSHTHDDLYFTETEADARFAAIGRSITAGTGLSGGGDLSADRSISLANTAVTPGAYTSANITVDAQGRITAAANGSSGGIGGSTGATDNRVLRSDGTGGATLQNSAVTIDDSGNVDVATTWNASGTTFNAFKVNATDTASAAGSLLACFQKSTSDRLTLTKHGGATLTFDTGVLSTALTIKGTDGTTYVTMGYPGFVYGTSQLAGFDVTGGVGKINVGAGVMHITHAATNRALVKSYVNLELCPGALGGGGTYVEINNGTAGTYRDLKCRTLTLSELLLCGVYTFSTVPSASANTGATIRISDRSHRLATSDGTNWNWAGTTTAIS